MLPSYQELLKGKNTFDEDDSRESLDCGMASSLDAGTALDVGTEPSLDEDVVSGVVISGSSRVTEEALELSSEQAEKRIARLNKAPIAVNIFFFMSPFLLNGHAPNIYFFALNRNLFIALIRLAIQRFCAAPFLCDSFKVLFDNALENEVG